MCKKIVMKIWMFVGLCSRSPGLMDLCHTKFKNEVETFAYFEHPKSLFAHTLLSPVILLKFKNEFVRDLLIQFNIDFQEICLISTEPIDQSEQFQLFYCNKEKGKTQGSRNCPLFETRYHK